MFQKNFNLSALNTLALSAHAAYYARVSSAAQLNELINYLPVSGKRRFVLGSGSNLVLTGDFDGFVLHIAIPGRRLIREDTEAWYVRAGAGENWNDFVQWTLAQGWAGLENLSLIPGTVGAAPIQNIGAYGLEVAERIQSLTALDTFSGKSVDFDRTACRFAYRDSIFRQEGWHLDGRFVVSHVTFRLPKCWEPLTRYAGIDAELAAQNISRPDAQQIADAVISLRRRKLPDPAQIPNAGSFFLNPLVDAEKANGLRAAYPDLPCFPQTNGRVKLAAGWLIEHTGWKGKNLGPVGMYENQALILVNHGGATSMDILALMQAVQNDVRKKFGVELAPEPVFL